MLVCLRIVVVLVACVFGFPAVGQSSRDAMYGTHFEVAFPKIEPSSVELPLPRPYLILIRGNADGTVRVIRHGDSTLLNKEYKLEAGKTLSVEIKQAAIALVDGDVLRVAVTITSDVPVTVSTAIGYQGNGLTMLHHPVGLWGKQYHTFTSFQDRYGPEGNASYRAGEIVVTAAHDGTMVHVTPTSRIAKGPRVTTPIEPGETRSFAMNAHEVLLLRCSIDVYKTKEYTTDLTGSRIVASKPVAVMSGHAKGGIGRMPDVLPPSGTFAAPAHWVRNCMAQSLLPDELADTQFVTAPLQYTPIRMNMAPTEFGDFGTTGDEIRVVAISDRTIIKRSEVDGKGLVAVDTLNAGEFYLMPLATQAHVWMTSKPAHIVQYGRSWAKMLPLGGLVAPVDQKAEQVQGHPTVESGQPHMMIIPGTSRWVSSGGLYPQEGLDNFMNVVVRIEDTASIVYRDDLQFTRIGTTDFAYARTPVPFGDLTISAPDSVKFMAWSYGSLDGLQLGRAYGQPVAVNYFSSCSDTLDVQVTQAGSHAHALAALDTICSAILSVTVSANTNVNIDSTKQFAHTSSHWLSLADKYKPGTITLTYETTSGQRRSETITLAALVCTDTISTHVDAQRTQAFVEATLPADCTSLLPVESTVNVNVDINVLASTDSAIQVQVTQRDTTLVGIATLRFTSALGQSVEETVEFVDREVQVSVSDANPTFSKDLAVVITETGSIRIRFWQGAEGGTMRLYDYAGRLVLDLTEHLTSTSATPGLQQFDVAREKLSQGFFVVVYDAAHDHQQVQSVNIVID